MDWQSNVSWFSCSSWKCKFVDSLNEYIGWGVSGETDFKKKIGIVGWICNLDLLFSLNDCINWDICMCDL